MFVHFLKFKMPIEFSEFIKILKNKINSLDITLKDWDLNFSYDVKLFECQTKGHAEKIKTLKDVNLLYNGFVEIYNDVLPILNIAGLTINRNHKGYQSICLVLSSQVINEMRIELARYHDYNVLIDNEIIYKTFQDGEGKLIDIQETFNIEYPIISQNQLKKNTSIYNLCVILSNLLIENDMFEKEITPENLYFKTENGKCKKIKLW